MYVKVRLQSRQLSETSHIYNSYGHFTSDKLSSHDIHYVGTRNTFELVVQDFFLCYFGFDQTQFLCNSAH